MIAKIDGEKIGGLVSAKWFFARWMCVCACVECDGAQVNAHTDYINNEKEKTLSGGEKMKNQEHESNIKTSAITATPINLLHDLAMQANCVCESGNIYKNKHNAFVYLKLRITATADDDIDDVAVDNDDVDDYHHHHHVVVLVVMLMMMIKNKYIRLQLNES